MNIEQLSIFDLPPVPPLPKPAPQPKSAETAANPFDWDYDIPKRPDITSILSVGDRVIILEKKYQHGASVQGIVKGFVSSEVLVRRRDGEGLYLRKELHRLT